jgi:hypothetical protein
LSRGLAVGDLFNDGKVEVVVENLVGKPMILRPEGGPENHWISFQLEGVKSNRLAKNARVRATAGDLVQLGELTSGGSYLSQNDLRIHFGLGGHERLDHAEVQWPDGYREILTDLAADRFYLVVKGWGSSPRCFPRGSSGSRPPVGAPPPTPVWAELPPAARRSRPQPRVAIEVF